MKNLVFLITTTLVISGNVGISLALPLARNVYSQDAQGSNSKGIDLKVWSGYGLTINFMQTGETIKQVWLGDPSHFALTSNGNLCQRGRSNEENCGMGGATILFLRQIKPIRFPSLTSSQDGSTVITVITSDGEGQKQYQFKLTPARGKPEYTTLIVKSDAQKPSPILLTNKKVPITKPIEKQVVNPVVSESTNPSINALEFTNPSIVTPEFTNPSINAPIVANKPISPNLPRDDANALVYGLTIARQNGQIKLNSRIWNKVQDAIRLLRQGKNREEAISKSGISAQIFDQLIERRTRP